MNAEETRLTGVRIVRMTLLAAGVSLDDARTRSAADLAIDIIDSGERYVTKFASTSRTDRRTFSRTMHGTALPPLEAWLRLAQVARAALLISEGASLKEAATAQGWRDPGDMSRAMMQLLGVRPTRFNTSPWDYAFDAFVSTQQGRGYFLSSQKEQLV